MSVPPRIGFIGLGIMGRAMALNLVNAGFNVTVHNRDRARTRYFADKGCGVASSPKDLAKACNVIITMVSDDEALDRVLRGPDGVFAGAAAAAALINASTVSPECTRGVMHDCFKLGLKFIDCPVAGSKPLAESGKLVMLAAGEGKTVEEFHPVLLAMGKAVVYAGPAPAGTALKLCMNLIVAGMTSALAESAALAGSLGIDPKLIFSVLNESPALNCGYFRMKEANILNREFEPAFALKHMLKDVRFMLKAGAAGGQDLPVTGAIEKLMAKSYNTGYGGKDLSVVLQTLADYYRTERQ